MLKIALYLDPSILQGGGPQPEENPTGTILGNQAIKQEANAYINIKQQQNANK